MKQTRFSSWKMIGVFVLSDLFAVSLVWFGSVWLRYYFDGQFGLLLYWRLVPCLGLFITANAVVGLYPGILLSPPEELKKITQSTSVIFLALAGGVFMSKQGELYSRSVFLMAWVGALQLIPVFRSLTRHIIHQKSWWGYPAVILGAGRTGRMVMDVLKAGYRLGLRPVAFLDDDPEKIGTVINGVPVCGPLEMAPGLVAQYENAVAILAMPGVSAGRLLEVVEESVADFRRVVLVPDLFGMSSLWISAFDFGGILGLDLHQKLLDPRRQLIKRVMELALIFLFSPVVLACVLVIAILVRLDSRGPVLYRHKRIGLDGREITIWKFRTMVVDAECVLAEHLAQDHELCREWTENHKLLRDPRITRFGRLLRRTSLDELPQLWNVLRGDLSLVGPRPIIWAEVDKYQHGFSLYKRVKPGLTGLWQISGRSETSYEERVKLDCYYVRNWSVWFDIYILVKTPIEVLRCRGAC